MSWTPFDKTVGVVNAAYIQGLFLGSDYHQRLIEKYPKNNKYLYSHRGAHTLKRT